MLLKRILGSLLLAFIAAAVVLLLIDAFFPFLWAGASRLAAAAAVAAGFTVAALSCAAAMERGRARGWMLTGLLASALAALGWIRTVWFHPVGRPGEWLTPFLLLMPPTGWAGLMMLIAWLMLPRVTNRWLAVVRALSIICAALLAVHVCIAVCGYPVLVGQLYVSWQEEQRYLELAWRSGAVLAILTAIGLLGVYVPARFGELTSDETTARGEHTMRITCPRCGGTSVIRSGGDTCAHCGLRISVKPL
ncbi:MAG: hypothetical protein SYC29_02415 [Planctomycetota bacterium]|nr:hypothetical protein [Planctomycetota bacterium]